MLEIVRKWFLVKFERIDIIDKLLGEIIPLNITRRELHRKSSVYRHMRYTIY
jgi:hypothetical protein